MIYKEYCPQHLNITFYIYDLKTSAKIGDGHLNKSKTGKGEKEINMGRDKHIDDAAEYNRIYNENIKLEKQMKQKDEIIDKLNKEIKQLKENINESKIVEKDKLIEKLKSEVSKLKDDLSIAQIL